MSQSPNLTISALDHLVLTVADMDRTIRFYEDVLGMVAQRFTGADGTERVALHFGSQKINLHLSGHEFEPKAHRPQPGSADLCFLVKGTLRLWQDHLAQKGVSVELGPVPRTGATWPITSIYLRDPDQNLIELGLPG